MRPTRTTYRLAYSAHDYKRCHQLLIAQGQPEPQLSWPTVMAIRENVVVGCLSTLPHKHAIIAGPLMVTTPHPFITVMRLIEAYEVVLHQAGITSYYFGIDLAEHKPWLRLIAKVGMIPYQVDDDAAWFQRHLGGA